MQDIKADLQTTEHRIRDHRYLELLDSSRVSQDALKAFPGHQYHMWHSDVRSAAQFVQRFGDRAYGSFFVNDLQAEIEARSGIIELAGKLDMTEDDLHIYQPTAEGFAYAAFFAWLSAYGSPGQIACGLAVNLAAWGYNCLKMSEALREHYGFGKADTGFLDGFANLPSLEKSALIIIQDDLDHGVSRHQIAWAARMIQSYEIMFWDAMAAIADA
jgi:hypothetical protein